MYGHPVGSSGGHYLANYLAVPTLMADAAQGAISEVNAPAHIVGRDELSQLFEGEYDDELLGDVLGAVTPFRIDGDPPEPDPLLLSSQLREMGVFASPIYAVGPLNHISAFAGTTAQPTGHNPLPDPGSADPKKVVAVVDTGIVAADNLPPWMQPPNTDFEDTTDIEVLTSAVAESHGTFVAGLIRQIAPMHTVSIAKAIPVHLDLLSMYTVGGVTVVGTVTTELHVLGAIFRLIRRHPRGDRVEALNISLGAFTDSPWTDRWLVTIAIALQQWAQVHPECVVFAAGGNLPNSYPVYPAAFPGIRAVATAEDDALDKVLVWNPVDQPISIKPPWWITDVAPGADVVSLSGHPGGHLAVWSGSSFASAIATACFVSGQPSTYELGLTWWTERPIDYGALPNLPHD